jgi:hypothetical protein
MASGDPGRQHSSLIMYCLSQKQSYAKELVLYVVCNTCLKGIY